MLLIYFFSLIFINLTIEESSKCAFNPIWNFDFLNSEDFLAEPIKAPNAY